jgi:hypothetical protein
MRILILASMMTLVAPAAAANESPAAEPRRVIVWAPAADFYPQYIADPLRPQSALKILGMVDSEIPDTGSSRFALHLGGRFGLVRWHPPEQPDRGWQLDFEGGFFGHFDIESSLDNIGWDGLFGLYLSWLPNPDIGFRVGTKHDSAHVGDEYAEATGRRRIQYTREEIVLGVSWRATGPWRLYAEGGLSLATDDFEEPGRIQAGVEYLGARRFWKDRMRWYAAADLQSFQQNDWQPRSALQLGLIYPTGRGTSRYRFAIELVHGPSVMGEFSFRDETSLGVGWYFDF